MNPDSLNLDEVFEAWKARKKRKKVYSDVETDTKNVCEDASQIRKGGSLFEESDLYEGDVSDKGSSINFESDGEHRYSPDITAFVEWCDDDEDENCREAPIPDNERVSRSPGFPGSPKTFSPTDLQPTLHHDIQPYHIHCADTRRSVNETALVNESIDLLRHSSDGETKNSGLENCAECSPKSLSTAEILVKAMDMVEFYGSQLVHELGHDVERLVSLCDEITESLSPVAFYIYVLLAKHGDSLLQVDRCRLFTWSSKENWIFSSVQKNGSPFDVSTWKEVFEKLVYLETETLSEKCCRKLLRLKDDAIVEKEKSNDWIQYIRFRLLFLQSSGRKTLSRMLNIAAKGSEEIPVKGVYGPLNSSNSCALESLLYLFPYLFWELARLKLFGVDEDGFNLAIRTRGCALFHFELQELFHGIVGNPYRVVHHKSVSSKLRVLMQDLAELYSLKRTRVPGLWFPERENPFINLQEVMIMLLPRLLGVSTMTVSINTLQWRVVCLSEKLLSEMPPKLSIPAALHRALEVNEFVNQDGCVIGTIPLSLGKKVLTHTRQRLIRSSTITCGGVETNIIGYVGYCASSKRTHFVAGKIVRNKGGREVLYVHDGLKNYGKTSEVTPCLAFTSRKRRFDTEGLVLLATRKSRKSSK